MRAVEYTTANGMEFLLEGGNKKTNQTIPENKLDGLSQTDCLVFEELTNNLVRKESGSLFIPVGRIHLNGYNLVGHNDFVRYTQQERPVNQHR